MTVQEACRACGHTTETLQADLSRFGWPNVECTSSWCWGLGEAPGACGMTSDGCEAADCADHGIDAMPDRWEEVDRV